MGIPWPIEFRANGWTMKISSIFSPQKRHNDPSLETVATWQFGLESYLSNQFPRAK
jgi:hypothetical protein